MVRRKASARCAGLIRLLIAIGASGAGAAHAVEPSAKAPSPPSRSASASATAPGTPPPDGERRSLLNDAEKLVLKFRGFPDLSGDYRVGADGAVSIPVIGRVRILDLSPEALEAALSERLATLTGREAFATVEIAEYRPIFVTGYVSRPGSLAWQPTMTVLQAVAMSGGLYRAAEVAGPAATPADAERARIRRATADLKLALANLARLRAERKGVAKIEMPPALASLAGQAEMSDLLVRQETLLSNRRTSFEGQLAALDLGRKLAAQELEGLQAQSTRLKELLSARKAYKRSIDDLQSRGVVTVSRGLEEDIRISDLEEKRTNTAVAIARVQASAAGLQREAIRLTADKAAEIETEIQRTEREVAQLEIELNSAKETYTRLTGELVPSTDRSRKVTVGYSVVRQDGTGTVPANPSTRLRSGDVLVVSAEEGD